MSCLKKVLLSAGSFDPNLNNLYYGGVSMLIGLAMMIYNRQDLEWGLNWGLLCLAISGLFGHLQQLTFVLAVRNESPATVNMIECLAVVWSLLTDVFFFGVPVSFLQLLGILLVAISCIMISRLNMKK